MFNFLARVIVTILVMAYWWVPIALGAVALYHGQIIGLFPLALGLWLLFKV